MQENISIDVLTNWVSMLRADVDGAIWLSDDNVDARFYETIAHESSRIVPAQDVALALLASVEQRGIQGVVAVVSGIGTQNDGHNIFRPSRGDVLSLLLMSSHGERVIADICGTGWLSACQKESGPIRDRIVRIASDIRKIRHATSRELSAAFNPDRIEELIEWNSFEIAWSLVETLVPANSVMEVRRACDDALNHDIESLLRMCSGIDTLHLFAAATRHYRPRGLEPCGQIDAGALMGMLRVAFDPIDLERDEVFWKMKKWTRSNPRYPLLRLWRHLDPLGVLWDQRYWEGDLLAMLQSLEPGGLLAVFKMDLDNFKLVNERCGHTVGDGAIRLYCSIVRDVLGSVGEVYRRGGDEVIVLAPGLSEGTARELAETARAKVQAKFQEWASKYNLDHAPTASIGLTLANAERSATDIVKLVDDAQKLAKEEGKNRVVVLK